MKTTVLFDLGNTLVEYFTRAEQYQVLEEAIRGVERVLDERGLLKVSWDTAWPRAVEHNHEAADNRVTPLVGRLARIFEVDESEIGEELSLELGRAWLKPLFARSRIYDDSIPVLKELRSKGIRTAIVSNTPWGSPGDIWREEIRRYCIDEHVDEAVFCTDCGWRKPARQIFEYTMDKLGARSKECIFVGDDPRWDIAGPQAIGMEAVLIDRDGKAENSIKNLFELAERLR